jgi:hypothetical protein
MLKKLLPQNGLGLAWVNMKKLNGCFVQPAAYCQYYAKCADHSYNDTG